MNVKQILKKYCNNTKLSFYVIWFVCCWLSACSINRRIPEGDALFNSYEIKLNPEGKTKADAALKTNLDASVLPKPNVSIFGLRPKLGLFALFGPTKKEKGLHHFLSYKLGEPPVLLSAVDTGQILKVMQAKLNNDGYFGNTVGSTTTIKKKRAHISFTATLPKPYIVASFKFPEGDSLEIYAHLRALQAGALLKAGDHYNLPKLIAERERLNAELHNRGFYKFSPDLMIFKVDSTQGNREVKIRLSLKQAALREQIIPYYIDDIYVFTNYSLTDTLPALDTIKVKDIFYVPNEKYVRAKYLIKSIFIEKNQPYSVQNHNLTVSRLQGMGFFKFATIKYEPDTTVKNKLDTFIYLTPTLKKSIRLEALAVSKSNNFAGPGFIASFRNRNALKGSESFAVNLITNYETQVSGRGSALNSYEVGLNTELTFPRFVAPVKLPNIRTEFAPKTKISAGISMLSRVQYFQMNSANAAYTFNWRPKHKWIWQVTPINLQYVQLYKTTSLFDSLLQANTFLKRSFQQQYILGSIYSLTYTNQSPDFKSSEIFNAVSIDLSGNTSNAIKTLVGADKPTPDQPRKYLNTPFSQYVRLENDFRYYYRFSKLTMLATRFITGAGLAYGNSSTLPYIKQFTIGGTNSIRAFRARSIGPGVYSLPADQYFSYFDQTGDIKLEGNVEYRFPLSGYFRGALFVDAGNIWLAKPTQDRPGGEFKANTFLSQLAVGTGFGLRVDVDFFVLRFDLGIPVRKPALNASDRNVLGNFKPTFGGNSGMVLNIAIGYPF